MLPLYSFISDKHPLKNFCVLYDKENNKRLDTDTNTVNDGEE